MRHNPGTVTVAPGVLATVAQLTALSVEGVARMAHDPAARIQRALTSGSALEGVRIQVADESVAVDLHVVAHHGISLLELGREIQFQVARAIRDTVGMAVRGVNVHIEDVDDEHVD